MIYLPLYTLRISSEVERVTPQNIQFIAHRATPTIRLLDNLSARGSAGSAMRSQSWEISAVSTDRLGSFLNVDLEPRVAASLSS